MAEDLEKLTKFIEENKGKRKFKQTVELAINFKGIDFSKQDNKINLEVTLPHGKGKSMKIAVFANDNNVANEAKQIYRIMLLLIRLRNRTGDSRSILCHLL